MSERLFVLLLRFYPAGFRRVYDEEAVHLVLDRARDEKGTLCRVRLLVDLLWDLLVTISRARVWQEAADTPHYPVDGTVSWRFVSEAAPRPASLATGALVSLALLATLSACLGPACRNRHGVVRSYSWRRQHRLAGKHRSGGSVRVRIS